MNSRFIPGWLLILFICVCCDVVEKSQKPNILLVLTDDQGWGDVGYNGNEIVETPNLDQLAASGVRFDRFYVDPVCAPTRAAILTGRYPFRSGAVGVSRGWENMSTEAMTIAELLKEQGYTSGCFGKWHNGRHFDQHPLRQGFDLFFGFRSGGIGDYFNPILEYNDSEVIVRGFVADVLTDSAIAFMERNKREPFFCFLPYNTPHTPFQLEDKYFDKYLAKGCNEAVSSIFGMVENIDDNIGRIMNFLNDSELAKNTLVIFLSDNGPIGGIASRYNADMRGTKGSVYDGGVRVPAIFYWQGRIEPQTISEPVAHIDVAPTILKLVSGKTIGNNEFDGVNLWPMLAGEFHQQDRVLFTMKQISPKSGIVNPLEQRFVLRSEQYCMVQEGSKLELFDMVKDPNQRNDIASENSHVIEKLEANASDLKVSLMQNSFERPSCPIGQPGAIKHELFADEAHLRGGLEYFKGFGYNSDWITSWNDLNDSIYWEVDVVDTGLYRTSLLYTCSEENIGSVIQLSTGVNSKIENRITVTYDPDFIVVPDRVSASGKSSTRKPWKKFDIGQIMINKRTERLVLRALSIESEYVADVRGLVLERINN